MLFDMEADPGETKNLAADPSLAAEVARHRQLLAEWRQTTEEEKYPGGPSAKAARRKAKRETRSSTHRDCRRSTSDRYPHNPPIALHRPVNGYAKEEANET